MSNKIPMNENDVRKLRASGTISSDEIAYYISEVSYAENVITGHVRRLQTDNVIIESRRVILHD